MGYLHRLPVGAQKGTDIMITLDGTPMLCCGNCAHLKDIGRFNEPKHLGLCADGIFSLRSQHAEPCRHFEPNWLFTVPPSQQSPVVERPKCLACGAPLSVNIIGRDRFCAVCGCYLPRVTYDLDAKEMKNAGTQDYILTKRGWMHISTEPVAVPIMPTRITRY